MNNHPIEILNQKRKQLLTEKEVFLSRINAEINEIEVAMERVAGKKVWEIEQELVYDDTNPDYIKGSIEE